MRWPRWGRGRAGRGSAGSESPLVPALRAVLRQDWNQAEELLAEVVRRDSGRVEVYLALAELYRRRGDVARAIRIHQNLLLRTDLASARRTEALRGLAEDFRHGGFLGRAVAAYQEVLDRTPRDPEVIRILARLCAEARDHGRALALARRLARSGGTRASEEETELLVELARSAQADGKSDEARRALKRALRRDKACAAAWAELAALDAERGRPKRALAAWQRAATLDRRGAGALYPRIEATYAALGRPRDFEKWLRQLVAEHPEDVEAQLALVRSLAARGEADGALAEVTALLERERDQLPAHVARARLLLDEGRDGEAAKALADLLASLERLGLLQVPERVL